MKIKTNDYICEYDNSPQMMQYVFNRLIEWYEEYEAFCGEQIQQSDKPSIDSPNILSEIADDIIKFKVTWKD